MGSITPEYRSCIKSLGALEIAIKDRDTYWFPTWTINSALAKVKTDFSNLEKIPLSNKDLYTLSSRCSDIKSLVQIGQNTTPSKTWGVFSLLFPRVVVSPSLVFPMTEASKALFEKTQALKNYESLSNTEKEALRTTYKNHLIPSLFFLAKEFSKENSIEILKLAAPNINGTMNQKDIEKILKDIHYINKTAIQIVEPKSTPTPPRAAPDEAKNSQKTNEDHVTSSLAFLSKQYPRTQPLLILKSATPFILPSMSQEEIEMILTTIHGCGFQLTPAIIDPIHMPKIREHICNAAIYLMQPNMSAAQVINILLSTTKAAAADYRKTSVENKSLEYFFKSTNLAEACKMAAPLIHPGMKTTTISHILIEVSAISDKTERKEVCEYVLRYMQEYPNYKEKEIPKRIREERKTKTDSETKSDNQSYYNAFSKIKTDNEEIKIIVNKAIKSINNPKIIFDNPKSQKELKSAYKKLSRLVHPDKRGKNLTEGEATELFKFISESYLTLNASFEDKNRAPDQ